MLPPANPIITKEVDPYDEKVYFKMDPLRLLCQQEEKLPKRKDESEKAASKKEITKGRRQMDKMTLTDGYDPSSMQFMKHDNKYYNKRGKIQFLASLFIPFDNRRPPKLP